MKNQETNSFKYTQKNIVVGNKMRSVIIIDKKPSAKLGQNKGMVTKKVITNVTTTSTIKKKKCGGCSRNRRR